MTAKPAKMIEDEIIQKLRRIEQRYKERLDDAVREIQIAKDAAVKAQKEWMGANRTLALVGKEASGK